MSSVEVSGEGFLHDAAGTVPFFRDGNIPDEAIVETLKKIRGVYEGYGTVVPDEAWQAVLDMYHLPGATPRAVEPLESSAVGQ